MNGQSGNKINKLYLYTIVLTMLAGPVLSVAIECHFSLHPLSCELVEKWFVFWGVGIRLLTAGTGKVLKPAFTALEFFASGVPTVKLLFAN